MKPSVSVDTVEKKTKSRLILSLNEETFEQQGSSSSLPEKGTVLNRKLRIRHRVLSLAVLGVFISVFLHFCLIFILFFGVPRLAYWTKAIPYCLKNCLSCPAPCPKDQGFFKRVVNIPSCLAACLSSSASLGEKVSAQAEEFITVDIIEEVPNMQEKDEALAEEKELLPEAELFNLKGDSSTGTDEELFSEQAEAGLEAEALERPSPEAEKDAISLEKKSPPPKLFPPKVEKQESLSSSRETNKNRNEIKPLHEIINRSLGRDAAQRMLGAVGGNQDDPRMRSYLAKLRVELDKNWRTYASGHKSYVASYEITIEANGQISSFRRIKSSGDADFNKSVEAAIRKTPTLGALPAPYNRGPIRVAFTFSDKR